MPEDGFYLQYVKEGDEEFQESSLVLHRHRLTLENLTGLGQLPRWGLGRRRRPRNHNGSGSPPPSRARALTASALEAAPEPAEAFLDIGGGDGPVAHDDAGLAGRAMVEHRQGL